MQITPGFTLGTIINKSKTSTSYYSPRNSNREIRVNHKMNLRNRLMKNGEYKRLEYNRRVRVLNSNLKRAYFFLNLGRKLGLCPKF